MEYTWTTEPCLWEDIATVKPKNGKAFPTRQALLYVTGTGTCFVLAVIQRSEIDVPKDERGRCEITFPGNPDLRIHMEGMDLDARIAALNVLELREPRE